MAGSDIANKVRNGLAKAINATSDGNNLVELRQVSVVSDPINGDTETESWLTLTNAIFKSYDRRLIDGDNIKTSDRELVAPPDYVIKQNDIVRAYGKKYICKVSDTVSPAEVLLVNKVQCREISDAA